ncbi:hypothetical protein [Bradyrhizobium japonicum]|uniref:hypothetical protein n=1 Tax=Bradyrhizobium japonicum TaxID=375 RepID=UPI00040960DD|nr:hypothetical protein [Bradyrhizobium japonicum]
MVRTVILAAMALALAWPADARPSRHHHRAQTAAQALDARPAACRGIAWCGCWLRLQKGISDTRLNLARAWATVGRNAGGPAVGVIAVWRHHVGEIVGVPAPGIIILRSGNDSGRVRVRPRSTRGVIAYRWL